jgi:GNAT superfamily N-acetyltransferase
MNFMIHIVEGEADPYFAIGYDVLNNYFGGRDEMEAAQVLVKRFGWRDQTINDEYQLYYEMVVLHDGQGNIACVGDYSVIIHKATGSAVVVHLSHIYVNEEYQGQGIVSDYMVRLTTEAAQKAQRHFHCGSDLPIFLVGEMDHPAYNRHRETRPRIRRFLSAGLKLIDPAVATYYQPDFRPFDEIDRAGGAQGLPLVLMINQVGSEEHSTISGAQLIHIVQSLYAMYGKTFRQSDMAVVYKTLEHYPPANSTIALLTTLPDKTLLATVIG